MKNIISKIAIVTGTIIGAMIMLLMIILLPYLAVSVVWSIICWCFGIEFSAKVSLGIVIIIYILSYLLDKR